MMVPLLLLQVVLIAIRLDGIVEWPWLLVLSPTMITIASFWLFGPPFSYEVYHIEHDGEED